MLQPFKGPCDLSRLARAAVIMSRFSRANVPLLARAQLTRKLGDEAEILADAKSAVHELQTNTQCDGSRTSVVECVPVALQSHVVSCKIFTLLNERIVAPPTA